MSWVSRQRWVALSSMVPVCAPMPCTCPSSSCFPMSTCAISSGIRWASPSAPAPCSTLIVKPMNGLTTSSRGRKHNWPWLRLLMLTKPASISMAGGAGCTAPVNTRYHAALPPRQARHRGHGCHGSATTVLRRALP